jgi:hypothetical protein
MIPIRIFGKYWAALESSTDEMLKCSRGVDVALRGMRFKYRIRNQL